MLFDLIVQHLYLDFFSPTFHLFSTENTPKELYCNSGKHDFPPIIPLYAQRNYFIISNTCVPLPPIHAKTRVY